MRVLVHASPVLAPAPALSHVLPSLAHVLPALPAAPILASHPAASPVSASAGSGKVLLEDGVAVSGARDQVIARRPSYHELRPSTKYRLI